MNDMVPEQSGNSRSQHLSTLKSDDVFNLGRFDGARIQAEIDHFTGLDKAVYDFLLKENRLTPMLVRQCMMTVISDGTTFSRLMLTHGTVKSDELVQLSLELSPAELAKKEMIDPTIPSVLIRKHQIMLSAVTHDTVYLSTLKNRLIAEMALRPYYPNHQFYFTPSRPKSIFSYIDKAERYGKQQGTLLEVLVRMAIRAKASDIHIVPNRDQFSVKFRELGELLPKLTGGGDEYLQLVAKAKTEARLDPADRRTPQDGKFSLDYNGISVDIRVSTLPVVNGKESVVLRLLNPENSQVQFRDLGISKVEEILKAFRSSSGVVLVCGVTGSGKSTTIASALRWVFDRYSQAINTLEDPVENEIGDLKQTPIDDRAGMTYAKALRAILRQDPDVVFVGEIRDSETASTMFMGADTGHLMISTIHVGDIRTVISRLLSLNVEMDKILNQLRGILIQKLIRVVCKSCAGEGCSDCAERGYTSRTVVSECIYLKNRDDVSKLMDYQIPAWWESVLEDAYNKYRKGDTDRREMVSAFGTDFEEFEKECAASDSQKVIHGIWSEDQFCEMYPTLSLSSSLALWNKEMNIKHKAYSDKGISHE